MKTYIESKVSARHLINIESAQSSAKNIIESMRRMHAQSGNQLAQLVDCKNRGVIGEKFYDKETKHQCERLKTFTKRIERLTAFYNTLEEVNINLYQ